MEKDKHIECNECDYTHHETNSFCEKCGACLYKNSVQDIELVLSTGFPFHTCTKCGQTNFWD